MPTKLIVAVLSVLMMGMGTLEAKAHPMTRDAWSLRTAVQLSGDSLDVVVVLEVPFAVVTTDLKAGLEAARMQPDASTAAQAVLDAYTERHWSTMGKGLTLTVDGKPVKGAWKARKNRLNGKGAVSGGFFMYIVEFVPDAPLTLGETVELTVTNASYPEPKMVYSAMVIAGEGWSVTKDGSKAFLPDKPYDLNAPEFWVEDDGLRTLDATYQRTP